MKERLQKILSAAGVCSRRAAEALSTEVFSLPWTTASALSHSITQMFSSFSSRAKAVSYPAVEAAAAATTPAAPFSRASRINSAMVPLPKRVSACS